ncbi:uncharacterized protein K460DRAFT_364177, partial [Cucurbitaria berberidis CBS 394.84]
MPSKIRVLVYSFSGSYPGTFISVVASRLSSEKLSNRCHYVVVRALSLPVVQSYHSLNHGLLLPIFGDIGGNSLQSDFIFFTNTKYASRASTFVGNVVLRSIHIFKYLSELKSFKAAYHSPDEDDCFNEIARCLPPSPVIWLACFRQAAFNSLTSASCSGGSCANEPIPIFDRISERTGFEDAAFGDFGDGSFGDATFGDVDLDDDVFEDDVFEDEVLEDEVLEDEVFGAVVFEDDAVAEDVFLDDEGFEDEAFGVGVLGVGVFGGVVFAGGVFDVGVFGASILGLAVFLDALFEGVVGAGVAVTF